VIRLGAALAVLVLVVLATACGTTSGDSGPAAEVTWDQGTGFGGLYSAAVTPSGGPSVVVALRVVHDGTVTTAARSRFPSLQGRGSIQVQATRRRITARWTPTEGDSPQILRLAIPVRMRGSDAAWSGSTVSRDDGEQTIWEQERTSTGSPSGDGMTIGSFAALVRDSVQYPRRTAYCLTLAVEGRPPSPPATPDAVRYADPAALYAAIDQAGAPRVEDFGGGAFSAGGGMPAEAGAQRGNFLAAIASDRYVLALSDGTPAVPLVAAVFPDAASRDLGAAFGQHLAEVQGMASVPQLQGPNWLLWGDEEALQTIQGAIGGRLGRSPDITASPGAAT
jgi:hypothetical protein